MMLPSCGCNQFNRLVGIVLSYLREFRCRHVDGVTVALQIDQGGHEEDVVIPVEHVVFEVDILHDTTHISVIADGLGRTEVVTYEGEFK